MYIYIPGRRWKDPKAEALELRQTRIAPAARPMLRSARHPPLLVWRRVP